MTPVFADTYYYLAIANPRDEAHQNALAVTKTLRQPVLTTEFVLLEVADAMSGSDARGSFLRLLDAQRTSRNVEIVPASSALITRGLSLYADRTDKDWPLTGRMSFVVMEERGVREALTGDRHFEQAGFVALLK